MKPSCFFCGNKNVLLFIRTELKNRMVKLFDIPACKPCAISALALYREAGKEVEITLAIDRSNRL